MLTEMRFVNGIVNELILLLIIYLTIWAKRLWSEEKEINEIKNIEAQFHNPT